MKPEEIQKIQTRMQELYAIPLYVEPRQWTDVHAQELQDLEARAGKLGYELDCSIDPNRIELIEMHINRAKFRRRHKNKDI